MENLSPTPTVPPVSPEPETRRILKLQLVILLLFSVLLHVGFTGLREWRLAAEARQLTTTMRGWDGLAWSVWFFAAPGMLLIIRKFPLTRGHLYPNLWRIAFWSFALYLVIASTRYFLRVLPDWWSGAVSTDFVQQNYSYNTFSLWPVDLLTYSCFFAVTFSLDYHFKYRQRAEEAVLLQVQTARLESELVRAELAALRGQLHPHFLFNSFNALATLVRQHKNEAAVEIIAQLSALLRLAIDRIGFQEVSLHQEIDFIDRYLKLEQVRFGEKLKVRFTVEPAAQDVLVPNIFLQPLVENAIKHGISRQTTAGEVHISARKVEGRLRVEIINDGPLVPVGAPPNHRGADSSYTGIGEANTRTRLEKLFGQNYRLERVSRPEGGALVVLDLPWRLPPVSKNHEKNSHLDRR